MKHLALILCVLAGCAPIGGKPPPSPQPAASTVTQAASDSVPTYAAGLAKAARDVSAKCDSFKSWADLFDALQEANKLAREDSFKAFEDSMTAALNPATAPWDAAKAKAALLEAADGFERRAK